MAGPGLGGVHSQTDVVVDFSHDVEFQSFFRTFVWKQNNNDSISELFLQQTKDSTFGFNPSTGSGFETKQLVCGSTVEFQAKPIQPIFF